MTKTECHNRLLLNDICLLLRRRPGSAFPVRFMVCHGPDPGNRAIMADRLGPERPEFPGWVNPQLRIIRLHRPIPVRIDDSIFCPCCTVVPIGSDHDVVVVAFARRLSHIPRNPKPVIQSNGETRYPWILRILNEWASSGASSTVGGSRQGFLSAYSAIMVSLYLLNVADHARL